MDEDKLSPDLRRDATRMQEVRQVAAAVLRQHGDDLASAGRTAGWANATWLSQRYAIRVGIARDTTDLIREAEISQYLPSAVGYPETVAAGVLDRHEYQLTRRVKGVNLADVWPGLRWDERSSALRQLWELGQMVHEVRDTRALGALRDSSPLYPRSFSAAAGELDRWPRPGC